MRQRTITVFVIFLSMLFAAGPVIPRDGENPEQIIEDLQQAALSSDLAWDILASLTSEVGPRMGGTEADLRAVKWAAEKMKSMGFDRVWTEPVTFPRWLRNSETAAILSQDSSTQAPVIQKLAVTALGGSPSTQGLLQARVIHFESLSALEVAPQEMVRGKIVFLSTLMRKTREGTGYGETVINRSRGPFVASAKGAAALLIRSVGTDSDRLPHTGMMSGSEPGPPVPSAAISNPDADNLMILLKNAQPVTIGLNLDVGFDGEATSYNVVGEFDGSGSTAKHVLLGAHLDSWDLGTGAVDDGAGVALVMAAASMVAELPLRPRHTIRVVLYANEEQGIYGGKEYARVHEPELANHLIGAESDLGAGRIYAFKTRILPAAEPTIAMLARSLKELGIERDEHQAAGGGADVGQMRRLGMPVIDLNQDASRYFDLHHTANDTLDKVDPGDLRQNLAAWVTLIYLTANSGQEFGPVEVSE